jgi:hypothetical protein
MKLLRILLLLGLAFAAAAADDPNVREPDTDNVFFVLAHDPDHLVPLERQTATIHTSTKFIGVGATAKSSSEFSPGKSPVRVASDTPDFVVRSPFASTSLDFNAHYVLRRLNRKGKKRELIIFKARAYVTGTGGATSNLAEGELPITIARYGTHSLKITPPSHLAPGEYALSLRSAFRDLFCFGVD